MPVYEYEGKHYDLPDGLSPEQAKAKITGHLRTSAAESSTSKVLDVAGGVGEFAMAAPGAVLSELMGGLGGVAGALIPGDTAAEGYARGKQTADPLVYEPRTDTGKAIMEKIGQGVEGFKEDLGTMAANSREDAPEWAKTGKRMWAAGMSALPEASMLAPMLGSRARAQQAPKANGKGLDAKGVIEAAKEPIAEPADRPSAPGGEGAFTEMQQQLRAGENDPVSFPKQPVDRMQALVDELEASGQREKAAKAQAVLDERQAAMEFEMKKQQGLDFNAAERTRQLEAPVRSEEHVSGRAMDTTAEGLTRPAERTPMGPEPLQGEGMVQHQFLQELKGQAVENHPFVRKAVEKVTKQEELIIKLKEQVQDGRATTSQLVRAVRDLENLEMALEKVTANVQKGVSEGQKPAPFNFKRQGGGVNLQALIDETPRLRDLFYKLTRGEKLSSRESSLIRALEKDDFLGFDNPKQALKNLIEAPGGDWTLSPRTKAAMTNLPRQKPFNFKKQGGAVNPAVFDEGFQKIKQHGEYTLEILGRQWGPEVRIFNKAGEDVGGLSTSAVYDQRHGGYPSGPSGQNLSADFVKILTPYQKKGLAEAAYKFLAETGSDIQKSSTQLQPGREMWKRFEEKGLAKDGLIKSPGNKQRGALLIDPKKENEGKFLSDNPALKLEVVPTKLKAEDVIEMSKSMKDVDQNGLQKLLNQFTKGGIYQTLKTHNPVVRFFNERITEADRLSRGDIQREIHDKLGPATRAMSKREKAEIWEVINQADLKKLELTEEQLRQFGANDKQIAYWKTHREVMDMGFESINRARKEAGLEPIDRRIAYAAMKSTGDYRRLVYKLDENGKPGAVVGIIGSNARWLLDKRVKLMEEKGYSKDKGYVMGEEKYFGGVPKQAGGAQQALAHTLEVLAKDDPRIAEFMKTMDEITTNEAYSFLNMKKHTLDKKGVFGMEGRKDWATAEQNAHDGMQAQLDYMESALKWGRLSEAVSEVKPILSNESINMPQAKAWAENYMKNALGYNPSKLGHRLEQAMAEGMRPTGVGYSNVRSGVALARKTVNTLLLGLDPGFWLTNVVQPMRAMPGMKAYLVSKGLDANFDFGTGWSYLSKAGIIEAKAKFGGKLTDVEQGAYDYAKSHHVYGSDLVEHSNRASKDFGYRVDKVGNFVASNVESATRQMMFFAFTDMLHQNGLSVKNGLYEAAHNLTDMTMNNYSPMERPNIYNHMGPVGDISANLSSFKHNEISRVALLARQLSEEKSARPILAELAASVAFAGLTGTLAFQEADYIYQWITKKMGKPDSLTLRAIKLSEDAADKVGLKGNNRYALSHGGFSMLGIDMSKRLGLGNAVSDGATDAVFPGGGKLIDIGAAGIEAAKHPSEMNAKRLAREVMPRPGASNMDLEWFSKENGRLGLNKNTLEAQVRRTPGDMMAKRFGFTGIHESVEKDKLYNANKIAMGYAELREPALNRAKEELFLNGKVSKETVQDYIKHQGDVKTLAADLSRISKKMNIPAKDRELLRASMAKSITSLRHAQRLRKVYEDE
jgi:hypothetical protein